MEANCAKVQQVLTMLLDQCKDAVTSASERLKQWSCEAESNGTSYGLSAAWYEKDDDAPQRQTGMRDKFGQPGVVLGAGKV